MKEQSRGAGDGDWIHVPNEIHGIDYWLINNSNDREKAMKSHLQQELDGDLEASFAEGDVNSDAPGSCARDNGGKVRYSLVPMHLLYGAAKVFMFGMNKYATWNWSKGGNWSSAFDSLLRHLLKWWYCGEDLDKESGLHHLDHAMCNLLFLIHYRDSYCKGDDRPPRVPTRFLNSLVGMNEPYLPLEAEGGRSFRDESDDIILEHGTDPNGSMRIEGLSKAQFDLAMDAIK